MKMEPMERKTLVFIIGPPAVGKMTVGRELSALTGIPLFHNHLSIEAVLPVFDFGTEAFNRLVTAFREHMLEEVAESDLPGLIFTFVWAFDMPEDRAYVEKLKSIFDSRGGRVVFAELSADQDTRLARNETEDRIAAKSSKQDVEKSRERLLAGDAKYRLNSDGDFPFEEHVFIDNSRMEPRDAALRIVEEFGIAQNPPAP